MGYIEHHKIIWLQPWCDACDRYDNYERLWCQDNVWDNCEACGRPAVKYVLASDQPAEPGPDD